MQTLQDGDTASAFRIKINYNFALIDLATVIRTSSAPTFTGGILGGPPAPATNTDHGASVVVRNDGGAVGDAHVAALKFECGGYYAAKMYLRSDGILGLGGGSALPWRWYVNMVNGDMTAAGNVTAYSDARLKRDVLPIGDALGKVKSLRGVTFLRNDLPESPRQLGFIAQEVQSVVPEVIVPSGDYLSLAYGNLTALLVEAIKELSQRVDLLEARP